MLTNYSVTTGDYRIHTAISMYTIRKHGCHDLTDQSAKSCTCPSNNGIQQEETRTFLGFEHKLLINTHRQVQILLTNEEHWHECPAWDRHGGGHSRHPELIKETNREKKISVGVCVCASRTQYEIKSRESQSKQPTFMMMKRMSVMKTLTWGCFQAWEWLM